MPPPPPPPLKRPPPPPPTPNTAANREPYLDYLARVPSRETRKADRRWQVTHRRMLRTSLALYASEVLRGPPEYGGRFLLGPHHLEWSDAVLDEERILALAARDHGKSHFWTFAYPLWMIDVVAPGKVGYIFSASRELAEAHLDKIRMEIMGGGENGGPNPKLAHLLPLKKDSKGLIKFANNSEIRARGFGSKARGGHPWWVVGDDMGNDEWIWSELVREKSIDYFLSAIRPMVVPGGQLIVVGTPFHARDLYQYLEDTGVYKVYKHAAINPRTGQPLWPERYDLAALDKTRKELGSELRFSREYLCVDRSTPVRTRTGYKPIEQVAVGDEVITHEGRWRRVLDVWRNPRGGRRMVRVVTSNNEGHVCTEDHKLLVVHATDYQRRNRQLDDEVWQPAGSIELPKWGAVYLKVPVPDLPETEDPGDDLAYLAGWYVAEGHCSAQNQAVYFSLNREKDPVAEIDGACRRAFGVGLKLYPSADRGSCAQYVLHSKAAKTWLSRFGCGAGSKTLEPAFPWTREAKLIALRAWFAGDGHDSGRDWRVSSVSGRLIADGSDMLLSLGIGCTVNAPIGDGPGVIEGRPVDTQPVHRLGVAGSNLTLLAGDSVERRQSRSFVLGGYLYSKVRKIEPLPAYADDEVFDLHVEEDHSYAGLHATFHNCRPISDDSSLFPPWLFELPGVKRPYTCGLKDFWEQEGMIAYAGVDLAMSASTGADYLVIFIIAVDPQGNRWVVDIVRRKGLGYQEQVDLIIRASKRYDCQLVFVEANQYQRVISDMIVVSSDVPIRAFYTTGRDVSSVTNERRGMKGSIAQNKNSLDRGVPSLRMLLENQKLRIPWAKATREVIAQWIGEMVSFGWANGKLQGVGAHDDTVMAMWMADQAAQKGQKWVPGFLDKPDEERLAKLIPNYWEGDEPVPAPVQTQRAPRNPATNRAMAREHDWFGAGTDLVGLGEEDGEEDWIAIGV